MNDFERSQELRRELALRKLFSEIGSIAGWLQERDEVQGKVERLKQQAWLKDFTEKQETKALQIIEKMEKEIA